VFLYIREVCEETIHFFLCILSTCLGEVADTYRLKFCIDFSYEILLTTTTFDVFVSTIIIDDNLDECFDSEKILIIHRFLFGPFYESIYIHILERCCPIIVLVFIGDMIESLTTKSRIFEEGECEFHPDVVIPRIMIELIDETVIFKRRKTLRDKTRKRIDKEGEFLPDFIGLEDEIERIFRQR